MVEQETWKGTQCRHRKSLTWSLPRFQLVSLPVGLLLQEISKAAANIALDVAHTFETPKFSQMDGLIWFTKFTKFRTFWYHESKWMIVSILEYTSDSLVTSALDVAICCSSLSASSPKVKHLPVLSRKVQSIERDRFKHSNLKLTKKTTKKFKKCSFFKVQETSGSLALFFPAGPGSELFTRTRWANAQFWRSTQQGWPSSENHRMIETNQ